MTAPPCLLALRNALEAGGLRILRHWLIAPNQEAERQPAVGEVNVATTRWHIEAQVDMGGELEEVRRLPSERSWANNRPQQVPSEGRSKTRPKPIRLGCGREAP